MTEIFGHRWTSAFGESADSSAGETWAKGLAGISPQQLGEGIASCLASADPWPPTLPEFRARCLGIPTFAAVKLHLRMPTKRPMFVHLVWSYLDTTAYKASPGDKGEKLLREAYDIAREHVMRGGALPETSGIAVGFKKEPYAEPPPEHKAEVIRRTRDEVKGVLPEEEQREGVEA